MYSMLKLRSQHRHHKDFSIFTVKSGDVRPTSKDTYNNNNNKSQENQKKKTKRKQSPQKQQQQQNKSNNNKNQRQDGPFCCIHMYTCINNTNSEDDLRTAC